MLYLPNKIKTLSLIACVGVFIFAFARSAKADDVTIHTYSPSPYASYDTVGVANSTNLSTTNGSVVMCQNGVNAAGTTGWVAIGSRLPEGIGKAQGPFEVVGATGAQHTASFLGTNGWGVGLGNTTGVGIDTYGSVVGYNPFAPGTYLLVVNGFLADGGGTLDRVGIDLTAGQLPAYDLHVGGDIAIKRGNNTGKMEFAYDGAGGGGYYAVYAP